mmetsp:Transcript_4886/g.7372  ORF Transcript_4886/g.7372 Transcript_4886/m.7372 type:complete len:93 (-) Transcript_4886:40-318(-)
MKLETWYCGLLMQSATMHSMRIVLCSGFYQKCTQLVHAADSCLLTLKSGMKLHRTMSYLIIPQLVVILHSHGPTQSSRMELLLLNAKLTASD